MANRVGRKTEEIDAVYRNGSLLRIVKAQEQLEYRAFASAGWPDKRDRFTRRNFEAHILQSGRFLATWVGEGDMVEAERACVCRLSIIIGQLKR